MRLFTSALGVACLAIGAVGLTIPAHAATVTLAQRQAAVGFVRQAARAATPCLHDFAPTIATHTESVDENLRDLRRTSVDCQRSGRALQPIAVPTVLLAFPQFRELKLALYDATKQGHNLAEAALRHQHAALDASMAAMARALDQDEATVGALLPQIQRNMGIAAF